MSSRLRIYLNVIPAGIVGAVLCLLVFNACDAAPKEEEKKSEPTKIDRVRWRIPRELDTSSNLSQEQLEAIARVEMLGYVDGIQPAPGMDGVTVHAPEYTQPGLNLFNSSHTTYAALMDMEGHILHEWSSPFETSFPEYPNANKNNHNQHHWRRVFLRPGGELIAIHEGMGMVCLDRDSRVIWSQPNKAHHDMDFLEDGQIIVLQREGLFDPRFGKKKPVLLDYIALLTPEGERIHRISLDQAFLDSEFEPPTDFKHPKNDVYHANTLEILDGRLADRLPAFAKGNILLSMRTPSLLAVLDLKEEKLVWVTGGIWKEQHQPTVLENGNLLLFDNKGGDAAGGSSRVLELDPVTLETVWMYDGTPEHPLDCEFIGTSSRLENGNTLIVESLHGRVIEVTPEGLIAWEYINLHRAGEHDEYIAVIPEMIRIDASEVADWLEIEGAVASDSIGNDE